MDIIVDSYGVKLGKGDIVKVSNFSLEVAEEEGRLRTFVDYDGTTISDKCYNTKDCRRWEFCLLVTKADRITKTVNCTTCENYRAVSWDRLDGECAIRFDEDGAMVCVSAVNVCNNHSEKPEEGGC